MCQRNRQAFSNAISSFDWDEIYEETDMQTAYSLFHSKFLRLYNIHFPKQKLKYNTRKPWLTQGLKDAIRKKNKLYKKYLKMPSALNEITYKSYRNKLNHILKKSERQHYSDLLTANKSNIKKIWQIMKNIVNKNKIKKIQSKFKLPDGSATENKTLGALVRMSRWDIPWDIPVCPGDVIICRRSCAEPGSGLFAVHFLPHDVTFSINRWCQVPPCGGNWSEYTSRSSGQNTLRTWPWSFLLITRYCFTLSKEWISPNSFLCIYNKNCHQANGDNRHLVPDLPIGLGRDIRDMPIACARTHPDANKHARHIPMYQPVHSAHANKCSPWHRALCTVAVLQSSQPNPQRKEKRKMYAIKQIKIWAEYRDMLPRPRLNLSNTRGLRPIGLSQGSWQTSLGLGSMSRYSAQILICIVMTP